MFEKKETLNKKEENRPRVQKDKKKKELTKRQLGLRAILIPFVLAATVVVVIYLFMLENTKNSIAYENVYIAIKSIPAHTYLTKDNMNEYFALAACNPACIPSDAVAEGNAVPSDGFYITEEMEEKEMLLQHNTEAKDAALAKYEAGYSTASIACQSFKDCVNGSIRRGDLIDIYAVNPATTELEKMATDVYVEEAYDNNGAKAEEDSSIATSFTVRITDEEIAAFNTALAYGSISVRK